MSDFEFIRMLNDEEIKRYREIIDELKSIDKAISDCFKQKNYASAQPLFDKRRVLNDELDQLQNVAFCRLSGKEEITHDFNDEFTDLILESERGDKTLSEKFALSVADFWCRTYPEKADIYKHLDGETLTAYINRIADYLQSLEESVKPTESVSVTRAKLIEYPLDKVNNKVWDLLSNTPDGQIGLGIIVGDGKGKNKGKQAVTTYSINFNGLSDVSISKKLTQFDKRVYIAVSALYNVGNEVVSLTQIYFAMGYNSKPNDKVLKKIFDSIVKLSTARIQIDNAQEITVYKRYEHFQYGGALLQMEFVKKTINGKLSEAAIHLFREPPLISYAKKHKQITTVKVGLLQSPLSKTEVNLSIEDYLIEQISFIKSKKRNSHILFDTLYKETNITDKKQRQRTPSKIDELLNYYKTQKYIKGYTIDKVGIDIEV